MEKIQKSRDISPQFNRVVYALFILLAVYQLIVRNDFIDGASSMGIALIFDPFDQTVTWNDRPLWQRAWLLFHLGIAAALLGYGISVDLH